MSILTRLGRYAAEYRARRIRARTYMEITGLPREIQKDIGWPDAYGDRQGPRRNLWN